MDPFSVSISFAEPELQGSRHLARKDKKLINYFLICSQVKDSEFSTIIWKQNIIILKLFTFISTVNTQVVLSIIKRK
jgi:hypothetical protein